MHLAQKTIFHILGKGTIDAQLHLIDILQCKVASSYTLVLSLIEVQCECILVGCTPVFYIVDICHIGSITATFERVITGYIADKPLWAIGTIILPHKRCITSCYILHCRIGGYKEILQWNSTRLNLGHIILTTCEGKD